MISLQILAAAVVAIAIGLTFLTSAVGKIANFGSVVTMATGLGLPARLAKAAAFGLIAAETVAATIAPWPALHLVAGVLTMGLGALFAVSAIDALARGRVVRCACFGGSGSPLGWSHVGRGALVVAAGAVLLFLAPPWGDESAVMVVAALALASCLFQTARAGVVARSAAADRRALAESTDQAVRV